MHLQLSSMKWRPFCSGGDESKPSGTRILPTREAISRPKCAPCFLRLPWSHRGKVPLGSDHNRQSFIVRFSIRVSVAEPIFRRTQILDACISFEGIDNYSPVQTKYKYGKHCQNHLCWIETDFPEILCNSVKKPQNGAKYFLCDFNVTDHKFWNCAKKSNAFKRNKLPEFWLMK